MGLFDLPAPVFELTDQFLEIFLPAFWRVLCWGILAGLVTMLVYRRLSNQDRIQELKLQQKEQQKAITDFDGELADLFPLIRHTLSLGMRQLGLSLWPALLATIPVLFLIIWVAGRFGYDSPAPGAPLTLEFERQADTHIQMTWQPADAAISSETGWVVTWPGPGRRVSLVLAEEEILSLPLVRNIPVIHKHRWWNLLMANPLGYLPDDATIDSISLALPKKQIIGFGPRWMQGWMFSFFTIFLLSSLGFKLILKID